MNTNAKKTDDILIPQIQWRVTIFFNPNFICYYLGEDKNVLLPF
jgi:hypothetical protein